MAKTVFSTMNAALTAVGVYWLALSVHRVVKTAQPTPEAPYFRIAFGVMTAINVCFLALFLLAAFQLVRLKRSGVTVHWVTSALLVAYGFLNGALWLVGRGIGMSIGGATGIGNMGIAPFELLFVVPYVYPIASSIVLLVTRRKMAVSH